MHLNTLAKFGASMVGAIGEIMAYYGAPPVRHVTGWIVWRDHSPKRLQQALWQHPPQPEVWTYVMYIDTIPILDSTLVRRITCYFHPGHCHVPARPVTMRAIEDFYERWLTAANPCRRGGLHGDVWSGAPRNGAANIFWDENNAEFWGLLTCGNCRQCRARLHNTCTYSSHSCFPYLLLHHHRLSFPVPHVFCIYRHDFPNRVSHSLPFPWLFLKKWCIARRLVRPRFADHSCMLFVSLSFFSPVFFLSS